MIIKIISRVVIAFIGALSPIAIGLVKNIFWVGYSFVEALIFMWAFNYAAPILVTYGFDWLPTTNIDYWFSLSVFLLIGFIGTFIKKLVPTIVKVNQIVESKKE